MLGNAILDGEWISYGSSDSVSECFPLHMEFVSIADFVSSGKFCVFPTLM